MIVDVNGLMVEVVCDDFMAVVDEIDLETVDAVVTEAVIVSEGLMTEV